MNFKHLILTTILLLNNPITLCAENIDLDDLLKLVFLETKHGQYLNNLKIPIYSKFKHQGSIDQPTKQLMQAILDPRSSLASVQAALNAGADPNVNYFTGYDGMCGGGSKHHYQPALIIAIEQRRFDIAEALILTGAGADVNLPSWESNVEPTVVLSPAFYETTYTPLTKLIANLSTKSELKTAQLKLVKLLLEHGANRDTPAIFIHHAEGAEVTTTEKYTALKLLMKKDCFMPVWYRTCGAYWNYPIYKTIFGLLHGLPIADEKIELICYGYCQHIS